MNKQYAQKQLTVKITRLSHAAYARFTCVYIIIKKKGETSDDAAKSEVNLRNAL